MDARPGRVLCDRARAWAALLPDRELSELERKLLDRHLAGCAGCRAFAHDVAAVAELIRNEELVPLPQPVSVPSWRRHSAIPGRLASLGAAAAVALMAIGIAARAPLPVTDESNTSRQLQRVTDFGEQRSPRGRSDPEATAGLRDAGQRSPPAAGDATEHASRIAPNRPAAKALGRLQAVWRRRARHAVSHSLRPEEPLGATCPSTRRRTSARSSRSRAS